MGIPFSTISPRKAPRLINPENYKASFSLYVPGLDQELSNLVCGTVYATLNLTATGNRLRTYVYNLLSSSNWSSIEFEELCNFCAGYVGLSLLKESSPLTDKEDKKLNVRNAIATKVPEAIKLWMSSRIYDHKELEHELGPELYSKSAKLNKHYQEINREIQAMNINPQQIAALLQVMGNQQNQAQNNNGMVNFEIGGNRIPMPMQTAMMLKNALSGGNQGGQAANLLAMLSGGGQAAPQANPVSGLMAAIQAATANNQQQNHGDAFAMLTGGTTGSVSPTPFATTGQQGTNNLLAEWRKQNNIPEPTPVTSVQIGSPVEESSMDLLGIGAPVEIGGSHSENTAAVKVQPSPVQEPVQKKETSLPAKKQVKFLVAPPESESLPKKKIFMGYEINEPEETTDEFKDAVSNCLTSFPQPLYKEVDGENERLPTMVVNTIRATESVMDLASFARQIYIDQVSEFPKLEGQIAVTFGNLYTVFNPNDADGADLFGTIIKEAKSTNYLKRIMDASLSFAVKEKQLDSAARSLEALDRWIANHINRFLIQNLNANVTIESFSHDFNDIETFIARNFGAAGTQALDEFMETLTLSIRSSDSIINDSSSCDELNSNSTVVGENTVVAYLNFTSHELALNFNEIPRSITKEANPNLYALIRTIEEQCDRAEFPALNHYIFTRDCCIYGFQKAPLTDSEQKYLIRAVNLR